MKIIECAAALAMCFSLAACYVVIEYPPGLNIRIGNFAQERDDWEDQNMLNYQLELSSMSHIGPGINTLVIVENGEPVSSEPPSYLTEGSLLTIPKIYTYIEDAERHLREIYKNGEYDFVEMEVIYNTEYHYPEEISRSGGTRTPEPVVGDDWVHTLYISLRPGTETL
jgi:hypothetical protein